MHGQSQRSQTQKTRESDRATVTPDAPPPGTTDSVISSLTPCRRPVVGLVFTVSRWCGRPGDLGPAGFVRTHRWVSTATQPFLRSTGAFACPRDRSLREPTPPSDRYRRLPTRVGQSSPSPRLPTAKWSFHQASRVRHRAIGSPRERTSESVTGFAGICSNTGATILQVSLVREFHDPEIAAATILARSRQVTNDA